MNKKMLKSIQAIPAAPPPAYFIKAMDSFEESMGMNWNAMRNRNVRHAMEQAWVDLGMDTGYSPQEMEDIGDFVEEVVENVLRSEEELRRDVLNEVTQEIQRRSYMFKTNDPISKQHADALVLIQEIVEELKKKTNPR
jgi:hypothetical protein